MRRVLLAVILQAVSAAFASDELDDVNELVSVDPEAAYLQAAELVESALAAADRRTAGEAAGLAAKALVSMGRLEPAAAAYQQAFELLLVVPDLDAALSQLNALSRLRYRQGRYREAMAVERRILSVAEENDLQPRRGDALSNLGVLHKRVGELDEALAFYEQALLIRRRIADRLGESQTLNNIGIMYKNWGDFFRALQYQLDALRIKRDVGEPGDVARTLGNIALIYRELGDHEQALGYQDEALRLLADSDDVGRVINAQANYAYSLVMLGRLDEAEAPATAAVAAAVEKHLVPHLTNALLARAQLELARGDIRSVLSTLDDVEPLAAQMSDPRIATDLLLQRSEVERQVNDLQAALVHLKQAQALAAEHANQLQLRRTLTLLAAVYSELGQDAEAYDHLRRSVEIDQALNAGVSARRLADQHARMLKQQRDVEMSLLSRDKQIAALELARQRQLGTALLAGLALTLLLVWVLLSRHRMQRRANGLLEQRNQRIREQHIELEAKAEALFRAATTDSLTGLDTRQHALAKADAALEVCVRDDRDLCVIMLDMDHFKAVNDNHTHMAGDQILRFAADAMRQFFGDDAIIGRFGGEEFIIVLLGQTLTEAQAQAESLRTYLETETVQFDDDPLSATISMGICDRRTFRSDNLMHLIEEADRALYKAKKEGRNRVKVAMRAG